MYEDITFEMLLQRMINKVTEQNPNLDTREGSIIYNALAPAALELQNMYIGLNTVLNETFADTASRDYLIKRASERGIIVEEATCAIRQGEFNIDVPIGSRFSLNQLNYIVIERISNGIYKLQCETLGIVGNEESGTLIPIDYIDGLTTAELTKVLIPGENEEETEDLRNRYFNSLSSQAFGGNVTDYKEKTKLIDGVGGVKVYPIWDGGGTVKLVIIDSTYSKPSQTLINSVQTIIDPTQNQGEGLGIAPIGHVVTVISCEETTVDITTHITYENGWTWEDIKSYVEQKIKNYFNELSSTWDANDNIIVRISQIETRLLNLPGIIDVADTTINEESENLIISSDNIPVLGSVEDV